MKIVAVTACPTGIAHTFMAKSSLEKAAKSLGHSIKIETQGAMGVENELTEKEIADADVVILAVSIGIEGEERFEKKLKQNKVMQIEPSIVIKDPVKIIKEAERLSEM